MVVRYIVLFNRRNVFEREVEEYIKEGRNVFENG